MKKLFNTATSYAQMTLGVFIICVGVYLFQMPNHFTIGGLSGLSVALAALLPVGAPSIFALLNIVFVLLGVLFFGKSFGIRTLYCGSLVSLVLFAFERLFPMRAPLTNQPLLELFYFTVFAAMGGALIFTQNGSCGGTDIAAMILQKLSGARLGRAMLITDTVIAASAFLLFGMETGLFSLFGLLTKVLFLDYVMENITVSKYFTIISEKHGEIAGFINAQLRRGATICDVTGTYGNEHRKMLLTVVNRSQAARLNKFIRDADASAFVVVTDSGAASAKDF